jgi:DNA modification methylase
MLEDALLALSNRGDIALDPFLGSGSTLIAAHKARRVCRGVEFDPLYVDRSSAATRPRRAKPPSSPRRASGSQISWREGRRRP